MDKLTPTLNDVQIRQNIDALQKGGMSNDKVQAYVNNYSKGADGNYVLKAANQPQHGSARVAQLQQEAGQAKTAAGQANSIPGQIGNAVSAIPQEGVQAGLTAASNIPGDAAAMAHGALDMAMHPVQTAEGIGHTVVGAEHAALNAATGKNTQTPELDQFHAVAQGLKDRYGSVQGLSDYATNHPVQFASDVLTAVGAGAGAFGKASTVDSGISTLAKPITKTAEGAGNLAGNVVGGTAKQAVKQLSGLDAPTVQHIIENPHLYTPEAMAEAKRSTLGSDIGATLDKRIADLSTTGKEYQAIRETRAPVTVDPTKIDAVLQKHGLTVTDGKITTTADSIPLSQGDQSAIEHFLSQYGPEKITSSNSLLNARKALDNLSSWDATKTDAADKVARDIRGVYDDAGKTQIPGLKELDAKYSPETQALQQLKKDLIKPDGSINTNAIANATGKGKDALLSRLESLSPGITDKITHLKAVEDVQNVLEHHKVGTYAKGAGLGYAASGGNPLGVVAGLILSSPENAVTALRALGVAKEKIQPFIDAVKSNIGAVNKMEVPPAAKALGGRIQETPGKQGGYINVGGKKVMAIDEPSKREISDIVQYMKTGKMGKELKTRDHLETAISHYSKKYGINQDAQNVRQKFENLLEKTKTIDKLPG